MPESQLLPHGPLADLVLMTAQSPLRRWMLLSAGVRFDDLGSPGCDQDMEDCMDAEEDQGSGAGDLASRLRLRQKTPAVLVRRAAGARGRCTNEVHRLEM